MSERKDRYRWRRMMLRRWKRKHVACSPDIPADAVEWKRGF